MPYIEINKKLQNVMNNIDIKKTGFKYFIDYKDNKEIKPLCTFFP